MDFRAYYLLLLSLAVASCHRMPCVYHVTYCKDVESVSLTAMDNTGRYEVLPNEGRVPANAFLLKVDFNINKVEVDCRTNRRGDYSCGADLVDTVKGFILTSDKRFNGHVAGSDLTSLSIGPDIRTLNDSLSRFSKDEETGKSRKIDINFYLREEPDDTSTHTFSAKFFFESGEVLETTSEPVKLLK